MLTIRKKLAEQAASGKDSKNDGVGGKQLKRRVSFRSQLLTAGKCVHINTHTLTQSHSHTHTITQSHSHTHTITQSHSHGHTHTNTTEASELGEVIPSKSIHSLILYAHT